MKVDCINTEAFSNISQVVYLAPPLHDRSSDLRPHKSVSDCAQEGELKSFIHQPFQLLSKRLATSWLFVLFNSQFFFGRDGHVELVAFQLFPFLNRVDDYAKRLKPTLGVLFIVSFVLKLIV